MDINHNQVVYIPKGEHDDPHELPQQQELEGSTEIEHTLYSHTDSISTEINSFEKLEYIYQHFQDNEKMYESDPDVARYESDNTLYPHINNDIEYGLFEDVINSYYLGSQIRDDFKCDQECYTDTQEIQQGQPLTPCTHTYDHITQHINNLEDPTQQNTLYTMEEDASLFTSDTATPCDYNITNGEQNSDTILENKPKIISPMGIHSQSKHKYRNVFGDLNVQYHDFNNGDALTFKDKYTALLQQELQNPYWCLHNPITTKSYQISSEMDVETMPHEMYFSGSKEAIAKINQVPYQTIEYDDGMFQAKLMDNIQVQIFIDNGATPSILPLSIYNKYPVLQKYPKTESHTPIHTGGGMIESHFWIKIPLKLDNQVTQIKILVCDSECPYDIVLGCTSLAQLSAWQDYASRQLYIQQISTPLVARNNVRILPGQTGIISLALKPSKTSFVPCHTIMGKGIAYVRPLDLTLPLRPVEIEFENNRCCFDVCNTSDSTIEFQYVHEVAYFDARSKGLVQINNLKHFPVDQYLHDRVTPVTLSPKLIAYDKPIDPAEMPHISTCTKMTTEDMNVPTQDDKYPWLDPDDK